MLPPPKLNLLMVLELYFVFKEPKLVLLESNSVLLKICQNTHHMPNLDHFLLSEGHLQVLCKEKYRLAVDTIRFRLSCKKSTIDPKVRT